MKKSVKCLFTLSLAVLLLALTAVFAGAQETVVTGSLSDTVDFAYDTVSGHLEISGTGSVPKIPEELKNVVTLDIREGITGIDVGAFYNSPLLREVHVAGTVETIEWSAFGSCEALESAVIEDGVKNINSAFHQCTKLKSLTLPERVDSIELFGFDFCESLEELIIPECDQFSDHGQYFIGLRSLKKFEYPDNFPFIMENGIIYNKDKTTLVACTGINDDEIITIPDSVTCIGSYAFQSNDILKEIFIPSSVSRFEYASFMECTELETVHLAPIPEENRENYYWGDWTFGNCTKLKNVVIPDCVKEIRYCAFSRCEALEQITIPDSVETIGDMAFGSCHTLKEITIPDSVTELGTDAFYYCTALEKITFGKNTEFTENPFSGCMNLRQIVIPEENGRYIFENGALYNADKTELICYAAANENESYTVEPSVDKIGDYAFADNRYLNEIIIPDTVREIGRCAFCRCFRLEKAVINADIEILPSCIFEECLELKEVILPESLKSISFGAFEFCINLREITIPSQVTEVSSGAFYDTILEKVTVLSDELQFISSLDRRSDYSCALCSLPANDIFGSSEETFEAVRNYLGLIFEDPAYYDEPFSETELMEKCCALVGLEYTEGMDYDDYYRYFEDCFYSVVSYDFPDNFVIYCSPDSAQHAECIELGIAHKFTDGTCDETCGTHYSVVTVPAVPATCTETGLSEYLQCETCGEVLTEPVILNKLQHTPVDLPRIIPTCTEDGLVGGVVCAVCGEILNESVIIPARGHDDADNDAYCDICGEQVREKTVIEKIIDFFNKIIDFFKNLFR